MTVFLCGRVPGNVSGHNNKNNDAAIKLIQVLLGTPGASWLLAR